MDYSENQTNLNYHIQQLSSKELLEVYRDTAPAHFPADELKPVSAIEALLEKGSYIGLGLFDKAEHLMGYALFLTVPDLDVILLDYYAILTSYRDLGLGSIFLQKIRVHFHDFRGILIETEDIDCASNEEELSERTRRNDFYRKNGAVLTDIHCVLFEVPFTIFFLGTLSEPPTGTWESPDTQEHPENQINMQIACETGMKQTNVNEAAKNLRDKLEAIYRFMLPLNLIIKM